jgi:hypothetical protein
MRDRTTDQSLDMLTLAISLVEGARLEKYSLRVRGPVVVGRVDLVWTPEHARLKANLSSGH